MQLKKDEEIRKFLKFGYKYYVYTILNYFISNSLLNIFARRDCHFGTE